MKDFLFFNYSWVPNSTFLFQSIAKLGYACDFVDEQNLGSFLPKDKYKCVVLYLHEPWTRPLTDRIIDEFCQESFLIQHDDTDEINVQVWSNRPPDLVLQREINDTTQSPYSCPVYPFHFPIASRYVPAINMKPLDVCFMGGMNHPRRGPFVQRVVELSKGSLKHLQWYVDVNTGPSKSLGGTTDTYVKVINSCKIGLNYFGNSFDAWRIWELASTKTAIIMPFFRNKSVQDGYMPFKDYCVIRDDFADLEEKILYMLENERYKEVAQKAFDDYNNNHTPQKCFEYYFNVIRKFAKI